MQVLAAVVVCCVRAVQVLALCSRMDRTICALSAFRTRLPKQQALLPPCYSGTWYPSSCSLYGCLGTSLPCVVVKQGAKYTLLSRTEQQAYVGLHYYQTGKLGREGCAGPGAGLDVMHACASLHCICTL